MSDGCQTGEMLCEILQCCHKVSGKCEWRPELQVKHLVTVKAIFGNQLISSKSLLEMQRCRCGWSLLLSAYPVHTAPWGHLIHHEYLMLRPGKLGLDAAMGLRLRNLDEKGAVKRSSQIHQQSDTLLSHTTSACLEPATCPHMCGCPHTSLWERLRVIYILCTRFTTPPPSPKCVSYLV